MCKYRGVHQWVYWLIIFNFHMLIAYSYYDKITQAGMELKRFLLQSSAQSRISCKVRQGSSGFYQSGPWRRHSSSGQIIPVIDCPHSKKVFSCIHSELLLLQLIPSVFGHPPCSTGKGSVCFSVIIWSWLVQGCLVFPEVFLLLTWTSPASSASLQSKCFSVLTTWVAFCWICSSSLISFLKWTGLKLDTAFQISFHD